MPKLSVIIPAYNEEATIDELIGRVKNAPLDGLDREIIVVNDASRDGTAERINRIKGIRAFHRERNGGKGAAVKTGMRHARGDIFLIQDGDLEYNPGDYPALLGPILRGESDFVIGSRFQVHGPRFFTRNGDPFFSHYVGNLAIVWLTNMLYSQSLSDYEGCYKAFTSKIYHEGLISADGFEFDNELMCKALRRGHRIIEVPIRYNPRLYGEGKKIRWHHGLKMLWTIFKWRFKRI